MDLRRNPFLIVAVVIFASALWACAPSARANVYATNIKLNGNLTNAVASTGDSVTISYILNEPASGGVTVQILSGATVVRTINVSAGSAGSFRGLNTIVWDGTDDSAHVVPAGNYSVSITARSNGYTVWTMTTDDNNDGNNIWEGRGIAVDRNTNSPFYGRVFAANSEFFDGPYLGYQVGILKCNADGSYADEGGFSTGGHAWAGDRYSPWKVEVSDDDYVYVNDWTSNGDIYRFDPLISSNSQLHVLRSDNWGTNNGLANLTGPAIFGTGTNTEIWMADDRYPGTVVSLGLIRYFVSADGTCTNGDPGTQMVALGGNPGMNLYPVDIAVDKHHNIYTIQQLPGLSDQSQRVFRFPAYDPSTNGGLPELNADWAVGGATASGDTTGDWCNAFGVAVDPTGTYLAVALQGDTVTNGTTKILYATNGVEVTNLDLHINISGYSLHNDLDCCWDAVGNVYYIDNYYGIWRAFSPPGTNQATTKAVARLELVAPPVITQISYAAGTVTITFTGSTSDIPSAFTLWEVDLVSGAYSLASGATIAPVSPGVFRATVPAAGPAKFYRISK
jgi:hypothetical protein